MIYNRKIDFKFLEYLYQHCDSKDLQKMHLKNVLNGKERIREKKKRMKLSKIL